MHFFRSLFNRQSPPLLGLDITDHNIKLVELSQTSADTWILEKCATEPLDHGWVVGGNIENTDAVLLALQNLLKKTGIKTKNVAMALPSSAIITRKMMAPAGLSDPELEAQVEIEANQCFPFALEEINLDFCQLEDPPNAQGDVEILIVASRKEGIQDRLALAEVMGLNLKVIDVESYASRLSLDRLIQQLPDKDAQTIIALFDIGSQSSTIQVLQDGKALHERDLSLGTAQLTKLIARQYGLTMEEAVIKQRHAEFPSDYKDNVLVPFITDLSNEIGHALQFFFTSLKYNSVNYVILSGDVSQFNDLGKTVSNQTSFPCIVANPFEGMQISSGVGERKLSSEAPTYSTACGLAMRRFPK